MFFLASVFVCLCFASAFNFFKTRKQRALIKNIKGPFTFPLIGSVLKPLLLTPKNFIKKSHIYIEKYGTFSRCWAFDRLFIPTTDYEFVQQLLKSDAHINTGYNLLKPWLGKGLLMRDGEEWQQRRKMLAHSFQPYIMDDFVTIFERQALKLVWNLQALADGHNSFDVYPLVYQVTMNVMLETALGIKADAQTDFTMEYIRLRKDATDLFQERFLRIYSANSIIFTCMRPFMKKRQTKLIKTMNRMVIELIEERRLQRNSLIKESYENSIYTIQMHTPNLNDSKHERTILDGLIEPSSGGDVDLELSNQEICDELNTFMFQGHMLTSSTLSFALVLIARHPGVQNKLLKEIQSVRRGDEKNSNWSSAQLNELHYMEQVLKETLRLYPAQPIIGRELKEQFEYTHSTCGNGIMPVGAEIYINLYEMLRNPEIFEDPHAFKPERQSINESSGCLNMLSFSMGPRNCIAQRFAMLELKMMLVQVLSAYEVLPFGNEMLLEIKIILRSSNGFQIGLKTRTST